MSRRLVVDLYVPPAVVTTERVQTLLAALFAAGFRYEFEAGAGGSYMIGPESFDGRPWAEALAVLEHERHWNVVLWTPVQATESSRDVFLQVIRTIPATPEPFGQLYLSTSLPGSPGRRPLLPQQFLGWALLLAHLTQPVYGWGGSDEGLLGRDKPPIDADEVAALQPLPIEWLNIYGQTYIERLGQDRILTTPAWRTDFLAAGGLAVTLSPHPDDATEEGARRAAEHLGIPGPRPNPFVRGR